MKIGMAGVGGIGSNVARHLVQAGIADLKLVDFDRIERTNLNRQFYTVQQVGRLKTDALAENLKAIRPQIRVETVNRHIHAGDAAALFADCFAVVEGLDDPRAKKRLVEELSAIRKPVVSASGIGGTGIDTIRVRRLGTCHIVGDLTSDQDHTPLFSPKIAIVAATMAAILVQQLQDTNG